jgi:hypothetical protein
MHGMFHLWTGTLQLHAPCGHVDGVAMHFLVGYQQGQLGSFWFIAHQPGRLATDAVWF